MNLYNMGAKVGGVEHSAHNIQYTSLQLRNYKLQRHVFHDKFKKVVVNERTRLHVKITQTKHSRPKVDESSEGVCLTCDFVGQNIKDMNYNIPY